MTSSGRSAREPDQPRMDPEAARRHLNRLLEEAKASEAVDYDSWTSEVLTVLRASLGEGSHYTKMFTGASAPDSVARFAPYGGPHDDWEGPALEAKCRALERILAMWDDIPHAGAISGPLTHVDRSVNVLVGGSSATSNAQATSISIAHAKIEARWDQALGAADAVAVEDRAEVKRLLGEVRDLLERRQDAGLRSRLARLAELSKEVFVDYLPALMAYADFLGRSLQ